MVKPVPSAKQQLAGHGHRKARQQKQAKNAIAQHGHKNCDQTHELEPVPRGHSFTTSTHGLFGQEVQSTAVAIHGYSPQEEIQPRNPRQVTAFAVPKTTGPRVSFGLSQFTCTKVWSDYSKVHS